MHRCIWKFGVQPQERSKNEIATSQLICSGVMDYHASPNAFTCDGAKHARCCFCKHCTAKRRTGGHCEGSTDSRGGQFRSAGIAESQNSNSIPSCGSKFHSSYAVAVSA